MGKRKDAAELLARLAEGHRPTRDELAKLQQLLIPKRGRPRRTPLRQIQDEFGRALAFAVARTQASYDDAIVAASEHAVASERRIKGSFNWIDRVLGVTRADLQDAVRNDKDLAERLATTGFASFTPKEHLLLGTNCALIEVLERELSADERAAMILDGSLAAEAEKLLTETCNALSEFAKAAAAEGLPVEVQTSEDFALLVQAFAVPLAGAIAHRLKGVQ